MGLALGAKGLDAIMHGTAWMDAHGFKSQDELDAAIFAPAALRLDRDSFAPLPRTSALPPPYPMPCFGIAPRPRVGVSFHEGMLEHRCSHEKDRAGERRPSGILLLLFFFVFRVLTLPERPDRLTAAVGFLACQGLLQLCERLLVREATEAEIGRITSCEHQAWYLNLIFQYCNTWQDCWQPGVSRRV